MYTPVGPFPMRVFVGTLLSFVFVLLLTVESVADRPQIYTGFGSNLALGGYDAVAYFTEGQPVKGSKEHTYDYQGATWRFSSEENLEAFTSDPEAYAPQYGGYCAWAMAHRKLAKGDPKVWAMHEGKLYLNINKKYQKLWLENIDDFIAKGDANWPGILSD